MTTTSDDRLACSPHEWFRDKHVTVAVSVFTVSTEGIFGNQEDPKTFNSSRGMSELIDSNKKLKLITQLMRRQIPFEIFSVAVKTALVFRR